MQPEKRREPRSPSYAKALLVEGQVPGYVRDLSSSGCQVAFLQPLSAQVGDLLSIRVIAEHDPSIRPFLIRVRVRRVLREPPWYSVGAEIEGSLDAAEVEAFEGLVRYYASPGR